MVPKPTLAVLFHLFGTETLVPPKGSIRIRRRGRGAPSIAALIVRGAHVVQREPESQSPRREELQRLDREMLVASRRATPSDSGAPSDQQPTAVAPPSGKPKRAAAKARKAAPEAEAAPSTGTDHPQEEKDDGEEEKAAEVAVAVAGEEAAAPAEPVKRKRGRRKLIHDEE
jgi:hypothetical protein